MSYSMFLVIFLGIPIAALLRRSGLPRKRGGWTLALIATAAMLYTAPWDNILVNLHVWSFDPRRVCGLVLGLVPLEEYFFYVLQVAMTGLLTLWLLSRLRPGRL